MPRRADLTYLLPALLLVMSLSCDESLPPRETPPEALRADYEVLYFGPYVTINKGAPTGTAGAFQISVANIYNDVLQDSATVEVSLDVWIKDQPAAHTIVTADAGNLRTGQLAGHGLITLEPGTPAVLLKQWSHRTQDSIPFWDYVTTHRAMTTGGVPFCESDTVDIVSQGTVRLFKYAPALTLQQKEFKVVYQIFDLPCSDTTQGPALLNVKPVPSSP